MVQRPRDWQNHAAQGGNRDSRGAHSGYHRGGRGQGHLRREGSGHYNVPNAQQVRSGAFVSIVLKTDQPSGRQVQGIVGEVLTSGDHPRGIKVRLQDGRVGRVQRIVTEEEARAESQGLSNLGRNGELLGDGQLQADQLFSRSSRRRRYSDIRQEDDLEMPQSSYNLGDFLGALDDTEQAPQSGERRADRTTEVTSDARDFHSAVSRCPVCGVFEGDELAVAHHVNSHFED